MRSLPEQAKRHTPAEFGETSRHAPVFFPAGRRRSPAPSQRPAVFCACRAELLSGTQERRGAFGLCASHPCCATAFPARIAAEAPRPCFSGGTPAGRSFPRRPAGGGFFRTIRTAFSGRTSVPAYARVSPCGGGGLRPVHNPGQEIYAPFRSLPGASSWRFRQVARERASLRLGKGLCRPFAPESGVHGRRSSPERDVPGAGKGVLARLHRPLSGLRFGAEDLGQGGRAMDVLRNLPQGLAEKARHKAFVPQRGPLPSCCRLARMSCRMLWRVVGACGRAFLTHKRGVREIAGDAFCRFRRFPCRSSLRFSSAPRPSGQERRRSAASWAGLSFPVRLNKKGGLLQKAA